MKEESFATGRNRFIELSRFVAALIIFFHHSDRLGVATVAPLGWIFVEYFFMLSGFFMTQHFHDNPQKIGDSGCSLRGSLQYMYKSIRKVMPYAIVGVLFHAMLMLIIGQIPANDRILFIAEIPLHCMLLNILGCLKYHLNIPVWYISCLAVGLTILS